jgi:hypothetical protein
MRNTVINPLTGRTIRIGGNVYNQLIIEAYDHINGELVRRESAPPLAPREHYLNTETNRFIYYGSRRYFQLLQAGWEIEQDYYLVSPWRSVEVQAVIAQAERDFGSRPQAQLPRDAEEDTPTSYEQIMDRHRDRLTELNITLCRECFYPMKAEDGEYCGTCRPENFN